MNHAGKPRASSPLTACSVSRTSPDQIEHQVDGMILTLFAAKKLRGTLVEQPIEITGSLF